MKFQLTITALIALTTALPSNPIAKRDEDTVAAREVDVADFNFTEDFHGGLDKLFNAIENIPDEILKKGDAAVDDWLESHGVRQPGATKKAAAKRAAGESDADFFTADVAVREVSTEEAASAVALWERSTSDLQARVDWWKVTKCVASIVQLLATTAVPAAKLLKIKKLIEGLGGAKQAVELMLKATTRAEKLKVGGDALVQLAAELMGINMVKSNCF